MEKPDLFETFKRSLGVVACLEESELNALSMETPLSTLDIDSLAIMEVTLQLEDLLQMDIPDSVITTLQATDTVGIFLARIENCSTNT
ncbi:MAG: phosphopantetheine-binding protein [Patescibacteria group bacterium]